MVANVPVEAARAAQGTADRAAVIEKLRNKKPRRETYRVQLSDAPVEAVREARRELERREAATWAASEATLEFARERVAEAEETLAKAVAEAGADSVLLVFHGIGRDDFNLLVDDHQPGDEDREKGKDYDPTTFPPALIAATCVDPGFDSEEEVAELIRPWNIAERDALFATAMSTCLTARVADWGKGSAATRS